MLISCLLLRNSDIKMTPFTHHSCYIPVILDGTGLEKDIVFTKTNSTKMGLNTRITKGLNGFLVMVSEQCYFVTTQAS